MSQALKPGDLIIDYSYARPSLVKAKHDGARAVIRYSAGAASDSTHASHPDNAGKLITPAEFTSILGAGLDVIANDEWYETRVTEGYDAGVDDGKAATALWRSCGLAKGATVYCSWDAAPSKANYQHVRRYLRGWYNGSAKFYRPDLYGGTPALRKLTAGLPGRYRIQYGWRPNAGSWSNDGLPYQPSTRTAEQRAALVATGAAATPAHIWQTGNYWFGKSADEDLILRVPVGSHLETLGVVDDDGGGGHLHPRPKPKPAHRVQLGDTFASIAQDWGVSVDALMAANPRSPDARLDIVAHP
jgi:hypothetical protein